MEVRYYPETDTAYIYLLEGGAEVEVDESEEVAPGVVVDFDGDERPVGIEIYEGAETKLTGNGVVLREPEDERALEIGRIWLAGYRAGQDDREPGERSSQQALNQTAVETAVNQAVQETATAHENRSEETATVRDSRSGQATERGSAEETTGRAE